MGHRIIACEGVDSSGSRYDLVNMLTNLAHKRLLLTLLFEQLSVS